MNSSPPDFPSAVAVIGGGPAGLMAAETLAAQGIPVDVFDAMPSVARKFLLAGKGGMNITHAEPYADFITRYGTRSGHLAPMLDTFGPQALRDWIHGLGIETFVGSSGRVFPKEMKAAPLLRAWLHRLRAQGVRFHPRHRWLGWNDAGALRLAPPQGERLLTPRATILALGGGSWAKLGSDGAWQPLLVAHSVPVEPLVPANCGFEVSLDAAAGTIGWSTHFRERHAGEPLKNVAARVADTAMQMKRGECLLTATGIEGGLIYALSAPLRDAITEHGKAFLELDLLPDRTAEQVTAEVTRPRGARSLASHLQSRLGLKGAKSGLLREVLGADGYNDPQRLARSIKSLRVPLERPRPLDEAISSAGGVRFEALDERLMLTEMPGVFCAGEMLDWDAPTGGYLLTACFATGRAAGLGAAEWLRGM